MKWITYIIPFIFAFLTGHKRQIMRAGKDFEWSYFWTCNAFRVYELVCGRRYGIKHEMSAHFKDGIAYHYAHSWEAVFALIETQIRQLFKWRFPYRVYIPILATPQGITMPASPYLFAIAFDTSANVSNGTSNISTAYTCTGSNGLLCCEGMSKRNGGGASTWPTNCTYNSVNLTKDDDTVTIPASSQFQAFYHLLGPATGSNTFALTWTAAVQFEFTSLASYSGVSQSGFPDSVNSGSGLAASSWVASTTVVASNCWLLTNSDNGVDTCTLSVGSIRQFSGMHGGANDSNGTVGTGSQSITYTPATSPGDYYWYMISIAPVASAATTTKSIVSDYIIFN